MHRPAPKNLADILYARLREDIFQFRLLPGDHFTETEIAPRLGASRTPLRKALHRLAAEGYIQAGSPSGWNVKPLDLAVYDHLYDLRLVLELAAVEKLCTLNPAPDLNELHALWLAPEPERLSDGAAMACLDEAFHLRLIAATGNPEIARVFGDVTERIRFIRRLDFTQPERIHQVYDEHSQVLRHIRSRRADQAIPLLRSHIEISKAEVRKITLQRLYGLRMDAEPET